MNMKIIIPMAGLGTRMRPHTWSKPKPLVSVAGKTSLEHLMDMFKTLSDPINAEFVFIVGPYLGELQIPAFIKEKYPNIKVHYVVQQEMKGQAHAIWLAREYLQGPVIIAFSDSLIESNFSFVEKEQSDGIVWVMQVSDPRRFGVAEVGGDGWVKRFIEKPSSANNDLAITGYYYIKSSEALLESIEHQIKQGITIKGEYFLADSISIMIERGAKIRIHQARNWVDTGTIESTLDANRALLERDTANHIKSEKREGVQIIAPSFIHPSAEIKNSTIGPYASIGANCKIEAAVISDSIIEDGTHILRAALKRSLIGRNCRVEGQPNPQEASSLNIGDNCTVIHP
jgi:glucose-1-phosphate thymidylyltransferase